VGYAIDDGEIVVGFPAGTGFSLFHSIETGCGTDLAFHSVVIRDSGHRVKVVRS
jgi:hypothetical protein